VKWYHRNETDISVFLSTDDLRATSSSYLSRLENLDGVASVRYPKTKIYVSKRVRLYRCPVCTIAKENFQILFFCLVRTVDSNVGTPGGTTGI